ncbi:MAG: type I DNA topoisomerase [Candidatus Cloacimonetes bacterium]|nr:type I DNA topoisomerase [Candidatus Cloacimonadota bacterium]
MNKGLIIVESPAKAGTIAKILHNEFAVKASMGHVRDLPKHDLGVDVEHDFRPIYEIDKKKTKTIGELRAAAKEASAVYLASDHDREGEAIAWHLSKVLAKELAGKKVYRIVFNEITAKAITASISEPGDVDMAKVDAQQARRVLDRIVGYTVSPLLWKVIAKDLSAGRVQSVALRLICEREQEIGEFVPREFWRLEANFWKDEYPPFKASLEKWQGKKFEIPDENKAIEIVDSISSGTANLSEIKRKLRDLQPQPPFITSTLQQEASKLLGFSSDRTMSIAQQLYEGIELKGETTGLITYMRTDSVRIAAEAVENCRELVKERFGADQLHGTARVYKSKSSAQDAHEAIRPTDAFHTPESIADSLTKEQLKLYTLIWQRFVATQMKPVKLENTSAKITLGEALFAASGNRVVEEGFMKAYPYVMLVEGAQIHSGYIQNNTLEHDALKRSQHFTSPPPRFTEASLIKELEARGIGRPSTYSSIISTIKKRKYVGLEKKSFRPTDLGNDVNRFLVGNFDAIFNVSFTAQMESKLDEVEEKKAVWHELVQSYYEELQKLIKGLDIKKEKSAFTQETDLVCDVCGEGKMVIKRSKNGEFLACNRFPACRNSKNFTRDANGKIVITVPKTLAEKCPQCGSPLVEKSGKFGEFIACSNYPKCKFARPKTTGITCPDCGKGEIVQRRSKQGRLFWSCTGYPDCKYISNDKPLPIACPNCGHPFIYEKYSQARGNYKQCPKCNTIME